MVYRLNELLRDVRIAIDENEEGGALLEECDADTLLLSEIIEAKVEEGVRRVIAAAPLTMLDGGNTFGDAVYWQKAGCGWILLPEDYMRLLVFKMSDWERPVYEAIDGLDPRYALQFSRCRGLRGNPQKPVVAITNRAEGRVLEFFSCKDERATVEQAVYLPLPKIDGDGGIDIPERCYVAVVYMISGLVLASIGQVEMSSMMINFSEQYLRV